MPSETYNPGVLRHATSGGAGSVFEPNSVFIDHVRDEDDVLRGAVAGFNQVVRGRHRMLIPRISRSDFNALELSRKPEVVGHVDDMLNGFMCLSNKAKERYKSTRKAVEMVAPGGEVRVVIVDRLPQGLDEYEMDNMGIEPEATFEPVSNEELLKRPRVKKYSLMQVFRDVSVREKYKVGFRQLETAKRVAASDPSAAAAIMQDAMNMCQTNVNVKVKAGLYVKDRVQASNTLGFMCYGYKPTSASVASEVIIDTMYMYGPDGLDGWHVSGPLKYARELSYVYWMMCVEGTVNPSLLLEMELVLLSINVYNGADSMMPIMKYHTGSIHSNAPEVGLSERTASLLTADQRAAVEKFSDRLLPVQGSDGIQIATAVRVTELHVLLNSHVVDADPLCTVSGSRVEVQTQLSRDLWTAKCVGTAEAWMLREPVVGETVAICYVTQGRVSCSSPLKVTSVDQTCVITTLSNDVMAGMSGGALVALSDLALLGVHSASTWRNLVAYRFGSEQFASLLDSVSESCFSRQADVDSYAARMSEHFSRRGLGKVFSTALNSMVPVYIGPEHVGMAVQSGEHLYTTCDAEFPLRFGVKQSAYVMETTEIDKVYRTRAGNADSPVFHRQATVYEKVFVAGFDTEAYMSAETSVMHVSPNGRSFIISTLPGVDKPVTGGLVIGMDGAVLGLCGTLSATTAAGLGYVCWPLPKPKARAAVDARLVLSMKFPFLNVRAWPDELIEEVFTHSSVGKYRSGNTFNAGNKPLANVGDNAAKAELYESLRLEGYPHSRWSLRMQATQSNNVFAKVAWTYGFAECLEVGPGAVFSPESKAYADLTEALLGAAYMIERREVFQLLCKTMGILGSGLNEPVASELQLGDSAESLVESRRTSRILTTDN